MTIKLAPVALGLAALAAPAQAAGPSAEDLAMAAALMAGSAVVDAVAQSAKLSPLAVVTDVAVPEPQTWAMMILGFGTIGAIIRRRRAVLAN